MSDFLRSTSGQHFKDHLLARQIKTIISPFNRRILVGLAYKFDL